MAIEIDIDGKSIIELRNQLKGLKNDLSAATDPAEMARLAEAAGKVKDKMTDINEQVAVFSAGSKFEQAGIALGQIGTDLGNLDFEGAAEKAQKLTQIVKGISFAEATKGLKDLGTTFLNLGKALLTNPLFFIPTIIIGILQALGLLKPIIEAITGVFKMLGDAVNSFLQSLGLVAETEKDTTEETKKLNDALKAQEETVNALNASYAEYRALQSTGVELDIRKKIISAENVLTDILRNRPKDFEAIKDAQITINNLNEKLIKEQTKARLAAFDEQTLIDKDRIDSINAELAANNGLNDAEKARAKELFDERQKLINAQLLLDVKRENIVKEGEVNLFKIQVDNANKIQDINKKVSDAKIEEYNKEQEALKKQNEAELKLLYQVDANKRKVAEDWAMTLETLQEQIFQNTLTEQQKEVQAVSDKYFALETLAAGDAAAQKIIAQAKADELALINNKYLLDKSNKDKEAVDEELARERDLVNAKLQIATDGFNLVSNLADLFNSGSEESAKKAFNVNKAVSIAQATIQTYQAAQGAYLSQMSVPTPDAPVRASIAAGIAVAAGIANVAKIAKTQYKSSTPPTNNNPGGNVPSPSTPSYNLFGGGNNQNTVNASNNQPINIQNEVKVKAYVSETDITNAQDRVARYRNSATL